MEKMGWVKGRGLKTNQDGIKTKGVCFQGHDNTWLAHQDDFQVFSVLIHWKQINKISALQDVLAALTVEHGEAGKNMDEAEKTTTLLKDF